MLLFKLFIQQLFKNHSYSTEDRFKKHEEVYNKHDYCYTEMPKEEEKILKYNHGEKSLKALFVIDLDIECILKEEHSCQNNSEKSCIEGKAKYKPLGWAMFIKYSFDATKNKLDYYRGMKFIKELFKKLKDHAMEIINYKEKEMMPRTDQETKF